LLRKASWLLMSIRLVLAESDDVGVGCGEDVVGVRLGEAVVSVVA